MSASDRKLAVAYRPLESLIPYARNARTHSDAQVAEIAASIRAFGWTNPVLVDGENGIIAGHGRVLAARKLGLDRVPVIELAGMSEAEKRAYVIADNKLALKVWWDEEMLAAEIGDLQALGFDLALTGFELAEIEDLLAGDRPSFPDEAPEPPVDPVTRPGDVWTMGPHRLVCGDATDPEVVRLALDGRLADLVFTDPPYGVPETDIAGVIGIDPKTLRRHYRDELKHGHVKANAKVAESLFRKATSDGAQSVTAAIFWLKTRAGWKETVVNELAASDQQPVLIVRTVVDPKASGAASISPVRSSGPAMDTRDA